jgi:hypothetical protein
MNGLCKDLELSPTRGRLCLSLRRDCTAYFIQSSRNPRIKALTT